MLMLPSADRAQRTDRRVWRRRKADREQAAEAAHLGAAGARARSDAQDGDPEPRGRGFGRRSADRTPEAPATPARSNKPFAPLVAQLIATALGLEQTRARRRGSMADAAAAYLRPGRRAERSRGEA